MVSGSFTIAKKLRVKFLLYHDELIDIHSKENYSEFKTILKDELKFEITNWGHVYPDLINDCDILVIGCPQKELLENDIQYIKDFVDSGGSLLIINGEGGDKKHGNNLSKLGVKFGINFDDTYYKIGVSPFSSRVPPITTGIEIIMGHREKTGISYSGCRVGVSGKADAIKLYVEPDQYIPIIGMYYERGCGRVIGIGSYTLFSNTFECNIFQNANRQLIKNLFLYLSERFREEIREEIINSSEKNDIIHLYDFAEENNASVKLVRDIFTTLSESVIIKGKLDAEKSVFQKELPRLSSPIQVSRIERLKNIALDKDKIAQDRQGAIKLLGQIEIDEAIDRLVEIADKGLIVDDRILAQDMIMSLKSKIAKKSKFIGVLKRIGDIEDIDNVLLAYLKECVGTYNSDFPLASTFFLGCVSERSIDLLTESYLKWCKRKRISNYNQIEKDLHVQSIKTKEKNLRKYFDRKLVAILNNVNDDKTISIFEFDTFVKHAFDVYRLNRNDIGHVKAAEVDLDVLETLLGVMEKYLRTIFKIKELLDDDKV